MADQPKVVLPVAGVNRQLTGPGEIRWLDCLVRELDNLRAALDRTEASPAERLTGGDVEGREVHPVLRLGDDAGLALAPERHG